MAPSAADASYAAVGVRASDDGRPGAVKRGGGDRLLRGPAFVRAMCDTADKIQNVRCVSDEIKRRKSRRSVGRSLRGTSATAVMPLWQLKINVNLLIVVILKMKVVAMIKHCGK